MPVYRQTYWRQTKLRKYISLSSYNHARASFCSLFKSYGYSLHRGILIAADIPSTNIASMSLSWFSILGISSDISINLRRAPAIFLLLKIRILLLLCPVRTFAMLELMEGDFGKLIADIVFNQNPRIDLRDEVACTITVSTYPYPYNGTIPYGYYSGSDKDWKVARRKAKAKIDELEVNEWQYRIDAGIQANILEANDAYRT